jgi:LysM repeat protein
MDPVRRRELTRYGAPAAFLVAVTIAVLLIKAGLNGRSQTTTSAQPATTARTTTETPTTTIVLTSPGGSTPATGTTTTTGGRYYVIQAGDTLGAIAGRYGTSVDQLMTLNPGLDAAALQPGQRIRVG